jgi:ADP-L-glycero-D-manno-heptose 6-epimerase
MIIVTGAAGFIGSVLVGKLNQMGISDIVVADDFTNSEKNKNLVGKKFAERIHRGELFAWMEKNHQQIDFIFHIGARTDTTEFNVSVFDELNLNYTKTMWTICSNYNIPLVYASSAATYGLGELGYDDNHDIVEMLKPLNPYGESKNNFDIWALQQTSTPPFWAGFKFFNVYGPNEYHKGRMASVVFHAFRQIGQTGKMKLFRSHNPNFEDGKQLRDFIYVKDVVDVLFYFYENRKTSGLYNLGTGTARAFLHLANATFDAMEKSRNIEFIDTPLDIRDKYQYFTEANMKKLRDYGYQKPFYTLEDGVTEYVKDYLNRESYQ